MACRSDPMIEMLAESLFADTALPIRLKRLLSYVKSLGLCPTRMKRIRFGWAGGSRRENSDHQRVEGVHL